MTKINHKISKALNQHMQGIGMLESLIAALIMAIIMLGLMKLQQYTQQHIHITMQKLAAERVAFNILETYPNPYVVDKSSNLSYKINIEMQQALCKKVIVIVEGKTTKATQARWFCD